MKKTAALIFAIALTLILGACGAKQPETSAGSSENMDDFSLCFSWWFMPQQKNVIDTGEGRMQKDLVIAGTAAADFVPVDKLLEEFRDIVTRYDLESIHRRMTTSVLSKDGSEVNVEPNTYYEITFTLNGKTSKVSGDYSASFYTSKDEEAKRFMEAVGKLREKVESLPEWKAMPEAEGAYE